jgi:peptidoglycan/LPS O-acetylase OafA/YrhL
MRRFNWPIWTGLLLSIAAFVSYPLIFVWNPVTRDFPWANLALFAIAAVLVVIGLRRAFRKDLPHPRRSKIAGSIVATLSALVLVFFLLAAFVFGRLLPPSTGAPQVGQKAPEFTLPDINNQPLSLTQILTSPINGKAPKGALLIFYRGYW